MIDGEIELLRSPNQLERAVFHDHTLVRRLDINRVRSWRSRFRKLGDRHCRHFAEQFCQPAGVVRIKMLHDYEGHSRTRRQMLEQFHRRFESAGRAANADDRAERLFGFPFVLQVYLAPANCGATALSLLRLRSRTSTLHSRGHVAKNDSPLLRIQAAIHVTGSSSTRRTLSDL